MSDTVEDPHCPECGEPIGQTATYCMHCSVDLTEERAAADADEDGVWDEAEATSTAQQGGSTGSRGASSGAGGAVTAYGRDIWDALTGASSADASSTHVSSTGASSTGDGDTGELLAPDGLVDNTLTALVGIVGGIVVGIVGTIVLGIVTGSGWAVVFGLLAWLGATAYLVRRRTVQGAVAKSSYAVALVLLGVPLVALSPVVSIDGGLEERGGLFVVLLVFVAIPAGGAAVIGWIASQFVPKKASSNEG